MTRDDGTGTPRDDSLSFLPVILSLTQNHCFLRSESRIGVRDDNIEALRDDPE